MRTSRTLWLALAASTALFATACNRAEAPDEPAADTAAAEPMASEPAPMPAEPADDGMAAGTEMSFAEMDKNGDGALALDELPETEMLHQHFSVADADGNGTLSETEVAQHRADMAGEKPAM